MWQIHLLLGVFFSVARETISKKVIKNTPPLVQLSYFYPSAFVFTVLVAFLVFNVNPFENNVDLHYAKLVGVIWSIGVYFWTSANKISMSKSQLGGVFRDPVTIMMSMIAFGEYSLLSFHTDDGRKLILGLLAFSVVLALNVLGRKTDKAKVRLDWVVLLIGNILLLSIGTVLVKHTVQNQPAISVLANQYLTSIFTIWILVYLRKVDLRISNSDKILSVFGGAISALALMFVYLALEIQAVSIVQPLKTMLILIFTVPIGLFVFKEHRELTKREILSMTVAAVGAGFLILS